MYPLQCVLTLVLLSVLCPQQSLGQTRPPLSESLESRVPAPPAIARINGRDHVVYELHLTNLLSVPIAVERVVVRNSTLQEPLLDLRGPQLVQQIGHPATQPADKHQLQAGARAVLYFWMPLSDGIAASSRLWHQVEFDVIKTAGRQRIKMEDEGVELLRTQPLILEPPLRGGPWVALYDPQLERGHRTVLYTINGRTRIPARFAIDWVRLRADATHAVGEGKQVADWYGYGTDVLAVADAVVADARDDIQEQALIARSAGTPLQNESGNYVALDLGAGRYAFYEHLKQGSLKVRTGDRVSRGQVIGQLGNSGSSSSGPHLHFHLSDAASALGAEGLPYALRCFDVQGVYGAIGDFMNNTHWNAAPAAQAGPRRAELPAPNVVVDFKSCD